jgi:hypothetical protein
MKYSNKRNYRDQMIVEIETVTKKTVKKKEQSKIKGFFKKLLKGN